jgi:hypothetical protein
MTDLNGRRHPTCFTLFLSPEFTPASALSARQWHTRQDNSATPPVLVSDNENDWTSIWPYLGKDTERATWTEFWQNGDVDTSYPYAKVGARADVSNLTISTGGKLVYALQQVPDDNGFLEGMNSWVTSVGLATLPGYFTYKSIAQYVDTIKAISNQGTTPIKLAVVMHHWLESDNPMTLNWDEYAETPTNDNTFAVASKKHGPIRSWFTRTANIYQLGCNTAVLAAIVARDLVRYGATVHGTPTEVGVKKDNGWIVFFDMNHSETLNADEPKGKTVPQVLAMEGWTNALGEQ